MTKRAKFPPIAAKLANHVLRGTGTPPTVMLGPVVWSIAPGSDVKNWYFVACSVGADGQLRIDQFTAKNDQKLAQEVRAELTVELIHRKPIVLHDFDDELEMARWCEAIAPSERTRSIRAQLERERAEGTHP